MLKYFAARKAVLITSGTALILSILLAIAWKDLVVYYYVQRLRSDSISLLEMAAEPPASLKAKAVSFYLATQQGAIALLSMFLANFESNVTSTDTEHPVSDILRGAIGLGDVPFQDESVHVLYELRWHDKEKNGDYISDFLATVAMWTLQDEIVGRKVHIPRYPSLQFSVLSLRDAMTWKDPLLLRMLLGHKYVLIVERRK